VDNAVFARLADRLRWDAVHGTVPGSLPVCYFGDLPAAQVATIGINPSRQEYHSRRGDELDGPARRFETRRSLGAPSRGALTDAQAEHALQTMAGYFHHGKPVYSWFQPLERVLTGFGAPYSAGRTAHLDLVQEATDPVWTGLEKADKWSAASLLERDLAFLHWQLETFPLRTVLCTSAAVLRRVIPLLNAKPVCEAALARVKWTVAVGSAGGRPITVAGWNIPLVRPTGLNKQTQGELGAVLAEAIEILALP
jgi:hypothetical protein